MTRTNSTDAFSPTSSTGTALSSSSEFSSTPTAINRLAPSFCATPPLGGLSLPLLSLEARRRLRPPASCADAGEGPDRLGSHHLAGFPGLRRLRCGIAGPAAGGLPGRRPGLLPALAGGHRAYRDPDWHSVPHSQDDSVLVRERGHVDRSARRRRRLHLRCATSWSSGAWPAFWSSALTSWRSTRSATAWPETCMTFWDTR